MRIRLVVAACIVVSGCNLAPDYQVPKTEQPAAFKETGPWIQTTPQSALPRQRWWTLYGDSVLNGLEDQIESANPTLAQAMARYDAARGFLEQAQSSILPALTVGGHTDADKQSANRPLRSANQPTYYGDNAVAAGLSWDLDLWGRIRNQVAAGQAEAQASFADLEGVRLSLQAQLADDYLQLRGLDAEASLLGNAVVIYRKALDLTNARHDKGIASGLDVGRAQAQDADAAGAIGRCEGAGAPCWSMHSPAWRAGRHPNLRSPRRSRISQFPNIPAGVPSTLLQRRPDIAAAERQVAATNAGIGVARAAFYPDISLSALGGFQNTGSDSLFAAPNAFWALGPSMALTVFDNGRHEGQLAVAKAANASAAATYRATVLKAFQEVETISLSQPAGGSCRARNTSVVAATTSRPGIGPLSQWRFGVPGRGCGPDHRFAGPAGSTVHPDAPAPGQRRIDACVGWWLDLPANA